MTARSFKQPSISVRMELASDMCSEHSVRRALLVNEMLAIAISFG